MTSTNRLYQTLTPKNFFKILKTFNLLATTAITGLQFFNKYFIMPNTA